MRSDRWHAIEQLFSRAADLDPADRSTFLEAEARTPDGDPDLALREEVERLLALDASGGGLLDRPLVTPVAVPPEAGPWRLLERIGEGGMGEVWRAERADGAFEQTAAVKLARPGLAADIADRFRAERQILATLEHPAIARLLDGGSASDGRPYFALEFVDGEPITTYCDHHRLGVNERLALFVEACEAVAYAHARLVVHRDLKPSNVLVGTVGADADPAGATGGERSPRVRLLDFGIAKLLVPDAEQTQTGRQLMTPAYAAPEQRHGGSVTTAADVYALGVLLYELLSGSRPDADVPTRPSEAVTTSMATGGRLPPDPAGGPSVVGRPAGGATPGADASSLRSTTSERLARRLRGDLDTICLKALRADPDRRYRSAAELAADVQRHLDGLPVEARPESASYRVGKFVRRHAAGTTAAVVALLAILGGAGVALWQAAEADRQRDRALAEATRAERVSGFVAGLFQDTNGLEANGDTITARQMLDRGLARLARLDDPAARGDLLIALSGIYSDLGQSEIADSAATQAVLAFRSAGDSTMVARAFRHLASVYVGAQAP
ncbi:MAG: serine/threonine-protein kinase, partial [Bacteroidota bacterium]